MPLIFQYGSNTNTDRLRARLGGIEDRGRAVTVGENDIARKTNARSAETAGKESRLIETLRNPNLSWR